jgi:hypothetical protein
MTGSYAARSRIRRLRIPQKFEQWSRPWHGRGVPIFLGNKQARGEL